MYDIFKIKVFFFLRIAFVVVLNLGMLEIFGDQTIYLQETNLVLPFSNTNFSFS